MIDTLLIKGTHFKSSYFGDLHLKKKILLLETDACSSIGHICDYLNPNINMVTLQANEDTHLLVQDSQLLTDQFSYNFKVQISCRLNYKDLPHFTINQELEPWCITNNFILGKSKEYFEITRYIDLFDSHKVTGELVISPICFFMSNDSFTVNCEQMNKLKEMNKECSLEIRVAKGQTVCFDKYHYQFVNSNDLQFMRLSGAT